jgi:hypothetical protein
MPTAEALTGRCSPRACSAIICSQICPPIIATFSTGVARQSAELVHGLSCAWPVRRANAVDSLPTACPPACQRLGGGAASLACRISLMARIKTNPRQCKRLDADPRDTASRSRGTIAPEVCFQSRASVNRGRRECRMLAAPMARQQTKKLAAGTTGSAETAGIPCAMGFRLMARSPRGPGFLAPVVRGIRHAGELGLSVGRPGPHAFAVRNGRLRPRQPQRPSLPASPIVTIALRPSASRRDGDRKSEFFEKRKLNIFRGRTGHWIQH